MTSNKFIPNKGSVEDLQQTFEMMVRSLAHFAKPTLTVYTIIEVAKILKCKERTVKHHLYEAIDLPYLKVGREVRIREQDLRVFLENRLSKTVHTQDVL